MTSTSSGAAFGLNGSDVTTPTDGFDLDAWIDGAKLPERACTIYGRPDLVAEYEALDAELHALEQHDDDDQPTDDRLGAKSDLNRIADRMADVRREMEKSARLFRFRAPTDDEYDQLREGLDDVPEADRNRAAGFRLLAIQCIEPAGITAEQFERLEARLGSGYFEVLARTANAARESSQVALPFSVRASVIRSTRTS